MKSPFSLFLFIAFILQSCNKTDQQQTNLPLHTAIKNQFNSDIKTAILYIDSIPQNINHAEALFKKSRQAFKKLEPILASIDINNYTTLNQPNILKIMEEDFTDIKIFNPKGYQVLEETIFTEIKDTLSIKEQAKFISNRLKMIEKNTHFNHLKNYHLLWMIKKEIARVAFTGITGFDSPVLENSLQDAQTVYKSIKNYLNLLKDQFKTPSILNEWLGEIDKTIADLNADFNNFDRYHFIKNHTQKQLNLWNKTVKDWNVEFPFELELSNHANSFFDKETFNLEAFAGFNTRAITDEKVKLGKALFYDKSLSKSKAMSCASCHQIDKAFTDGLKTPKRLSRNSPTLLYAALQKGFFYDKRVGGLEGQIVAVIENKDEFHTNFKHIENTISDNPDYIKRYKLAFPNTPISQFYLRNAIATYLRTLVPFNSKFDRNINSLENTLTKSEINGFNLFTGKAKCATCHFAPVFNGTIPPEFKDTEMELIGVPEENDTINAVISKDLGRYYTYKTPERKHFFKTPTIRNIEKTAPYMHNGVYNTLEEVVDFYNRGGGNGIGIEQELQTLPSDKLNLNAQEQSDLVAFMKTLTDDVYKI